MIVHDMSAEATEKTSEILLPQRIRPWIVAAMWLAIAGIIALSGRFVCWPMWNEYYLCRQLRQEMGKVQFTEGDDDRAQALVDRIVKSRLLVGLTRKQIEEHLGPPGLCDEEGFDEFGFSGGDIYYSVGKLPQNTVGGVPSLVVGGVPNLVIGFGSDGRCDRAMAIHTQ